MSQDTDESELWWISVGGNPCEPARVVTSKTEWAKGEFMTTKTVFTVGCNDGTMIERYGGGDYRITDIKSGIELVKKMYDAPPTPAEAESNRKEWEAKLERDRKRGIIHSYRRFA